MNKIKNNKGSAYTLVLVVMVLVSMTSMLAFAQINNEIKLNSKNEDSIEYKVEAQSHIEQAIAMFTNKIYIDEENKEAELGVLSDLAYMYAKEATFINSNGKNNTSELKKLQDEVYKYVLKDSNAMSLEELENLYKITKASVEGNTTNKNVVKDHLEKSEYYLKTTYDESKIEEIINNMKENVVHLVKDLKDPNHNKVLDVLNRIKNIENKLKDINNGVANARQEIIKEAQAGIDIIDSLLDIWENDYVKENNQYGYNSNQLPKVDIVKNKLEILKKELQLVQQIYGGGNGGGSAEEYIVKLYLPKQIKSDDKTYTLKVDKDNMISQNISYLTEEDGNYIFKGELSNKNQSTIPVIINSKITKDNGQPYEIKATMDLKIIKLETKDIFEMEYTITNWNE